MSRPGFCVLAAALLFSSAADVAGQGVEVLAAEGDGGGGFWDWLIKLSGPGFMGPRVSYFYETGGRLRGQRPWRIRLDLAVRKAVDREGKVDPDTASMTMKSAQLGVEVPIARLPIYGGLGVAVHQFTGDAFDPVSTFSVPITVGLRPRAGRVIRGVPVVPIVNASAHFFPRFGQGDFAPLIVRVDRGGWELVPVVSVGADFRF